MIVSINQPAYLPWLGYFHRIAASDLHIVLDHVDISHGSFANRNKVLGPNGPAWLTVPVRIKGDAPLALNQVSVDNSKNWARKHWATLEQFYRRAPHFDDHAGFFRDTYERDWELLDPLNADITGYLNQALGITTPLRRSSALGVTSTKSRLVLDLCKAAGADVYLSGTLGRDYLDEAAFAQEGIAVRYQDYAHPEYPQRGAAGFVPSMAAIDALFNCGPATGELLMRGNPSRDEYAA